MNQFEQRQLAVRKRELLRLITITLGAPANVGKRVVYVAGKITGLPYDEVYAKFKKAQDKLEDEGYLVLNPCDFVRPNEDWEPAMRYSSVLLNMSDVAYFLPDWQDSKGARMEWSWAHLAGIHTIYEQECNDLPVLQLVS